MSDKFDLGSMIAETLGAYSAAVQRDLDAAAEKAAQALVEKTKQTAPYAPHGKRSKRKRHYRSNITYTKRNNAAGLSGYVWHVKGGDYRLTHLLVHGHLAKDGSRVKGSTFLQDACDEVFPQFLADAEEACK